MSFQEVKQTVLAKFNKTLWQFRDGQFTKKVILNQKGNDVEYVERVRKAAEAYRISISVDDFGTIFLHGKVEESETAAIVEKLAKFFRFLRYPDSDSSELLQDAAYEAELSDLFVTKLLDGIFLE